MSDKLTEKIIGTAIEVHRALGPGLLESEYQNCLFFELKAQGFKVVKEISLPIVYKDIKLDHGYRIDLLVENEVVIELKKLVKSEIGDFFAGFGHLSEPVRPEIMQKILLENNLEMNKRDRYYSFYKNRRSTEVKKNNGGGNYAQK